MVFQFKNWRRSLPLLAVLLISCLIALAIAPTNNHKFYSLISVNHWVDAVKRDNGIFDLRDESDDRAQENEIAISGVRDEPDTGLARIKLAQAAMRKIVDNPFIGIGAREWTYFTPHPHNVLLECALTFWIPSALAFGAFFIISVWKLITEQAELTESVCVSSLLVAVLLVFLLICNLVQKQLGSFKCIPLFLLSGYASAMVGGKKQIPSGNLANNRQVCP